MRYIIIFDGHTQDPFLTKWFEPLNHWVEGMTVIDTADNTWTRNGVDWITLEIDHL
jgi:hypothetical protein